MIQLSQVSKTYRMGDVSVAALKNVTLTIERGEFVAIMGASGSGKSTLMHLLGLLDTPDSGSYRLLGNEVSGLGEDELAQLRSRSVGFVFQQFHLLPRATAQENVAMPLLYSSGHTHTVRALELLSGLGLRDRVTHRSNELSGGQQQRVAIARSLINDPEIVLADEPTGNLDSASSAEIMRILGQLNQQGKTVILVTHEPELAQYARRIIHMRDGLILSDVRNAQPVMATAGVPLSAEKPPARSRWGAAGKLTGLVHQALRTIAANKVRSGLSMLGILIGVGAVIAMMALGAGAKQSIQTQLSSLGSNSLMLMPGAPHTGGVAQQAGAATRLTMEDAQEILKSIKGVVRVSPLVFGRVRTAFGNKNWAPQVVGAEPDYAKMRASVPQVGRFFNAREVAQRARVVVIGTTVVKNLFNGANPIGEYIKINRVDFQVIGVLPEKGANQFRDQDDLVIVPVTTAMYRLLGRQFVDAINIEVATAEETYTVQDAIMQSILRRHRVPADQESDAFNIRNLAELQDALTATSRTMSMLLSSIAVISLLVGGIGIMNIMLVSVTERTREIGLRKAVGARRADILIQFLTEAVAISLTGGLLGILLGWGISAGISKWLGWAVSVSTTSVLLAFASSTLIGVVFGLWPARKAALLNPIEALRYE